MDNNKKISILIPIYNENQNIEPLNHQIIETMQDLNNPYEIIYIDDGSTDSSDENINRLCSIDKSIKLIRFVRNCGKTSALKAGLEEASGDYIITIDGDLQNKPNDIKKIISKLNEGFDMVNCRRKARKDNFSAKILPSALINQLISYICKHRFYDIGCGFKGFKKELTNNFDLYGDIHRFILPVAYLKGFKTAEVEVEHSKRFSGESKYNFLRIFPVIRDFLTIEYFRTYTQNFLIKICSFSIIIFTLTLFITKNFTSNLIQKTAFIFYLASFAIFLLIKYFYKNLKREKKYEIEYVLNFN